MFVLVSVCACGVFGAFLCAAGMCSECMCACVHVCMSVRVYGYAYANDTAVQCVCVYVLVSECEFVCI